MFNPTVHVHKIILYYNCINKVHTASIHTQRYRTKQNSFKAHSYLNNST